MKIIHELKTWPEAWAAVRDGRKRFELRRDDRGFAVGDVLLLKLWRPAPWTDQVDGIYLLENGCPSPDRAHTAATIRAVVTYKIPGGHFGLDLECCALGIEVQE